MKPMHPSSQPPSGLQSKIITTPHIMLTRENGISPAPFSSMNVSYGVGDASDNVQQNRQIIKQLMGIEFLVSARQIHSDNIYTVGTLTRDIEVEGFDALITHQPGVGLLIQQADCQAILLHDPEQEVIGAIHCGWRGNVLNIIQKTITRMQDEYRIRPGTLQAVVSPSLGSCCGEFIDYHSQLPKHFQEFICKSDYFDFQAISKRQLINAGVHEHHIDVMPICTVCNENFFSYRRAKKNGKKTTGRQGSIISLQV